LPARTCKNPSNQHSILAHLQITAPTQKKQTHQYRQIEFPHPTEDARAKILRIHSRRMNVGADVNFEELARSTDDFNAAQLKAVCVEAGMLALRRDGTEVGHEDFVEGIGAVSAKKKISKNYYS
jgi:26S proteasome regulatory subunit T5